MLRRGDERDLLSIGTERQATSVHLDCRQLRWVSTACRNGIQFRLRPLIVGLVVMNRREVNLRPVFRPDDTAFIEAAARQLLRLHFLVGVARGLHNPDVLWPFQIVIAFVIPPIDRASHDVNVAFVLRFRLRLFDRRVRRLLIFLRGILIERWRCFGRDCLLQLFFFAPFLFLLRQILGVGCAGECDRPTVRRPPWIARALRQSRKGKRIATRHGEHEKLRRLRLSVLLRHTREDQILSVRRPARRRIALAAGKPMRSFVASG